MVGTRLLGLGLGLTSAIVGSLGVYAILARMLALWCANTGATAEKVPGGGAAASVSGSWQSGDELAIAVYYVLALPFGTITVYAFMLLNWTGLKFFRHN